MLGVSCKGCTGHSKCLLGDCAVSNAANSMGALLTSIEGELTSLSQAVESLSTLTENGAKNAVNIVTEMANMIDSSRAYEANATAFTASKSMAVKGLDIGQV